VLGFSNTRRWVYPQSVSGRYQRIHRITGRVLLAFLVVVPWITIQGHPAARLDLPARRVHALWATFTAADGFLLFLFALLAVFGLFSATALYGRLWCGYVCPQTVFLHELIHPIERWTEGDRVARMRRERGPWTAERIARRAAKWALFALVALGAAMSFQSWFAGAPALWTGRAGPVDYTLVGLFAAGWFADFAWFREQLCNYVCPYARFQGALTDENSQVVAYDAARGEPRGKAAAAVGGCVDCNKCVVVCPQGIDIRDGYQLECINCARCVDACTDVQGHLGFPSLVSYATEVELAGGKRRHLRPRTAIYAVALTAVIGAIGWVLATHEAVEAHVTRQPGTLYTVDPDGWIRNTFLVRVTSRAADPASVGITVAGLGAAEVIAPDVVLAPGESRAIPLVVRLPPDEVAPRTLPFRVEFHTAGGDVVRDATFKTPGST
jgi:cytochrome c oxidase accessory protein FixG